LAESVFTRFWRFLKGYVTVVVEGFFIEKFTNLCAINDLPIWNLRRYGTTKLVCRTTINGYKQMRHQAKKCGCRVRLERRRGTPFLVFRYRKRKVFLIGILVFLGIVKGITSFIWGVEFVKDEVVVEDKTLLADLEELGFGPGTLKAKINPAKLANELMIRRGEFSWIGVEVTGMKLRLKLVEKVLIPERADENLAYHIVSRKDCLIESVNVYQGTAVVRPGDVVQAGQILVSGIVEMKNFPEKTEAVHSLGEITGRVWYEKSKTLKLSSKFENSFIEDFAYRIAYDKIERELASDSEVKDIQKKVTYHDNQLLTVTVTVETLEEVGIKQLISGSEFGGKDGD